MRIIGLAMDDNDRLFVSDPGLRHVLVFDANHKAEDVITDGMVEPGGLAIDKENRLLYVADVELDQVLVYDADTFKLLRKIGTTGHNHELTTPGDFAKPTGVAVDEDGNLYVCDTLNNRIEIFDADGKFISTYGKAGDGPGYFSRPKGVAIDSDGHIWVADGMQDRVQVFNKEAQLLITFGGHGLLPGQFQGLAGSPSIRTTACSPPKCFPGASSSSATSPTRRLSSTAKRRGEIKGGRRKPARGVSNHAPPPRNSGGSQESAEQVTALESSLRVLDSFHRLILSPHTREQSRCGLDLLMRSAAAISQHLCAEFLTVEFNQHWRLLSQVVLFPQPDQGSPPDAMLLKIGTKS